MDPANHSHFPTTGFGVGTWLVEGTKIYVRIKDDGTAELVRKGFNPVRDLATKNLFDNDDPNSGLKVVDLKMWRLDEHLVFSVVQERDTEWVDYRSRISKVVYEMKPHPGDHHPDGEIGVTKAGVYKLDSVDFVPAVSSSTKYKSEIEFSGKSSETNIKTLKGKFDEFSFKWSVNDGSSSNIDSGWL